MWQNKSRALKKAIICNKIMCINSYQLHLYPQVEMTFKQCTPLGRSSHPGTNSREPERRQGRRGKRRGREREKGVGRLDVHILNWTNCVCVMYNYV